MSKPSKQPTKADKLLNVLRDGRWHSTKELCRRVGHTFAGAKYKLVKGGERIGKEPHPRGRWQYRYRLERKKL